MLSTRRKGKKMARTKSNLTGDAIFSVIRQDTGKEPVTLQSFNSATAMNKASYAVVKNELAAHPGKRKFSGRPDTGYTVFSVTRTEKDGKTVEDVKEIFRISCIMQSKTAGKTFIGRAACYAAPDATLAPFVKKEDA